jgi:hypothetical protein
MARAQLPSIYNGDVNHYSELISEGDFTYGDKI